MSTRCPAQVKRTPLTGGEGTRLCFTRRDDPSPPARARRSRLRLARRVRVPLRLAEDRQARPSGRGRRALRRRRPPPRPGLGARPARRRATPRDLESRTRPEVAEGQATLPPPCAAW